MKGYILIIITPSDEESPFIYFIRATDVTSEMLEEMEYQTDGYPYWCLQSEDPEDPPCLYDIEKHGTRACPLGGELRRALAITRIFHYRC